MGTEIVRRRSCVLLHVGVSPYNRAYRNLACPCFEDGSFIFIPLGIAPKEEEIARNKGYSKRYRDLNIRGIVDLLSLCPDDDRLMADLMTLDNPDFSNLVMYEWIKARRTTRLLPKVFPGDIVYFVGSFVKVDVPNLTKFIEDTQTTWLREIEPVFSPRRYRERQFIGAFAHFTVDKIYCRQKYLSKFPNAESWEKTQYKTGHDDIAIIGRPNVSKYWNHVCPIGKGTDPLPVLKEILIGTLVKWSGLLENEKAEKFENYVRSYLNVYDL